MGNSVLDAIKNRRSVVRFEETEVKKEELETILEAGRWAPSWLNKQPWIFIVISDRQTKNQLSEVVPTAFVQGLKEAPVSIAVAVDSEEDSHHFVEDGAAAAQNMALATHSLGLHASWIGVFDLENQRNSAEAKAKKILKLPKAYRLVAILPIGHAKGEIPKKDRKPLRRIVYEDKFSQQ